MHSSYNISHLLYFAPGNVSWVIYCTCQLSSYFKSESWMDGSWLESLSLECASHCSRWTKYFLPLMQRLKRPGLVPVLLSHSRLLEYLSSPGHLHSCDSRAARCITHPLLFSSLLFSCPSVLFCCFKAWLCNLFFCFKCYSCWPELDYFVAH